jgi:hypothetical protein
MPGGSVIPVPLASSVICVVTQSWEPGYDRCRCSIACACGFMAAELHGPGGKVSPSVT